MAFEPVVSNQSSASAFDEQQDRIAMTRIPEMPCPDTYGGANTTRYLNVLEKWSEYVNAIIRNAIVSSSDSTPVVSCAPESSDSDDPCSDSQIRSETQLSMEKQKSRIYETMRLDRKNSAIVSKTKYRTTSESESDTYYRSAEYEYEKRKNYIEKLRAALDAYCIGDRFQEHIAYGVEKLILELEVDQSKGVTRRVANALFKQIGFDLKTLVNILEEFPDLPRKSLLRMMSCASYRHAKNRRRNKNKELENLRHENTVRRLTNSNDPESPGNRNSEAAKAHLAEIAAENAALLKLRTETRYEFAKLLKAQDDAQQLAKLEPKNIAEEIQIKEFISNEMAKLTAHLIRMRVIDDSERYVHMKADADREAETSVAEREAEELLHETYTSQLDPDDEDWRYDIE